jgi:polyhydroxybutyrate depolymerase
MALSFRGSIWLSTALLALAGCTEEADDGGTGGAGAETTQGGHDAGGGGAGASGGGGQGGAQGGGGAAASCPPGSKDGPVEGATGELTPKGVDYNVRTPPSYDPTIGHPLIVVYSPAGVTNPAQTEQFTGLTAPSVARGYLIAYVDHVSPASNAQLADAGKAVEQIVARWCIDEHRVYVTGHSDGGSVASLTGLNALTSPRPAAIAPSAAGVNGDYLAQVACPTPLAVMVLHSKDDSLFPVPGFGAEPADWWAGCASCQGAGATLPNGCEVHDGCTGGVEVQYCQGTGQHGKWPALNEAMLDFFDRFAAP